MSALRQETAAAWAARAHGLDRYRWRILRARHGLVGSALRFARDALVDWYFGMYARLRLARAVDAQSCDFLLLQMSPKVVRLQRKQALLAALRERGHRVEDTALQKPDTILAERLLRRPPQPVPTRYFLQAAHAQWLVERYAPKILLNDRNGSFYSPFLRLALNRRQCLLVHLAHATTVESSRRLGMNDYDYYFLFGQSSLEALAERKLRFGTSTVVLSGSYLIDQNFDLPPADPQLRTLLILGVGPDKEKEVGYCRTYALLGEWAEQNPDYRVLVKLHPRSRGTFWQQAAAALGNLQVLPPGYSLAEAIKNSSMVINIMSNAVIEAALARRPVIHVNASGEPDIFNQSRFFGECIQDVALLRQRIEAIQRDYPASLERAAAFSEYHLASGANGLGQTVALLEQLLAGRSCTGVTLQAVGIG
ncbi:capsule biosynthesis protein [Azomonas macrocytogenes]|uniref:Capsule biosynthesis protein n=1 Tax=Azomonas macrocytogenes TaxID=69962 RepID=A0A839T4V7_AZOMA|nr:capsule biosynthesis protein [Azomonas macrocytogenes]MBB3102743.1 hypothetical protein [Azomonas macrocytogenes]